MASLTLEREYNQALAAKRHKKLKTSQKITKNREQNFFTKGFDGSTELAERPELSQTVNEGNEGNHSERVLTR
jgi:hypothetical protein